LSGVSIMKFEEAKQRAEQAARLDLQGLYSEPIECVLDASYEETEHCWMFFHDRSIVIPPERALSEFAYAYGKVSGEGRCVPDFRNDPQRLKEYLAFISDYFATHPQPRWPAG
jgi:hypothetical protein